MINQTGNVTRFVEMAVLALVVVACVGMICLTVYKITEMQTRDEIYRSCMWEKGDELYCSKVC